MVELVEYFGNGTAMVTAAMVAFRIQVGPATEILERTSKHRQQFSAPDRTTYTNAACKFKAKHRDRDTQNLNPT